MNLTLEPGASVALVARAHGLNANQVFKWRRTFERGELVDSAMAFDSFASGHDRFCRCGGEAETRRMSRRLATCGSIHIEFPGRVMISVESGADPALLRSILESLRK